MTQLVSSDWVGWVSVGPAIALVIAHQARVLYGPRVGGAVPPRVSALFGAVLMGVLFVAAIARFVVLR